ncbi:MAG: hypothetical protein ABIH37_05495 [archaeon]
MGLLNFLELGKRGKLRREIEDFRDDIYNLAPQPSMAWPFLSLILIIIGICFLLPSLTGSVVGVSSAAGWTGMFLFILGVLVAVVTKK